MRSSILLVFRSKKFSFFEGVQPFFLRSKFFLEGFQKKKIFCGLGNKKKWWGSKKKKGEGVQGGWGQPMRDLEVIM